MPNNDDFLTDYKWWAALIVSIPATPLAGIVLYVALCATEKTLGYTKAGLTNWRARRREKTRYRELRRERESQRKHELTLARIKCTPSLAPPPLESATPQPSREERMAIARKRYEEEVRMAQCLVDPDERDTALVGAKARLRDAYGRLARE